MILDVNLEAMPVALPIFFLLLGAHLDDQAVDQRSVGKDESGNALLLAVGQLGALLVEERRRGALLPGSKVGRVSINHLRALFLRLVPPALQEFDVEVLHLLPQFELRPFAFLGAGWLGFQHQVDLILKIATVRKIGDLKCGLHLRRSDSGKSKNIFHI